MPPGSSLTCIVSPDEESHANHHILPNNVYNQTGQLLNFSDSFSQQQQQLYHDHSHQFSFFDGQRDHAHHTSADRSSLYQQDTAGYDATTAMMMNSSSFNMYGSSTNLKKKETNNAELPPLPPDITSTYFGTSNEPPLLSDVGCDILNGMSFLELSEGGRPSFSGSPSVDPYDNPVISSATANYSGFNTESPGSCDFVHQSFTSLGYDYGYGASDASTTSDLSSLPWF
ncbi:OLC1v1028799C1 [Oldenlandia corymbosa var. corymbosa]|uniref:OLC1v1028799C1 n=1 Tax=Oldenlandia corymbosa var. corymbosa TaxID=529605 RepID=A0AAV1CCL3_OLDCO|nr:OLC1v1028799C1 [Oldenlandia corymbosa var. corymbosa]